MNDEGATHYSGVIENLGLGHRLLNDTFGQCGLPRVGWQVGGTVTSNKEPFFSLKKLFSCSSKGYISLATLPPG